MIVKLYQVFFNATFIGFSCGGALHGTSGHSPVCTLPFDLLSCSTYVPKTNKAVEKNVIYILLSYTMFVFWLCMILVSVPYLC